MSNFRPILVQHRQNDASVETENYLRNKRWVIGNVQSLQRQIREQYRILEQTDLDRRVLELKRKLKQAVKDTE